MNAEDVLFRELLTKGIPARVEARKNALKSQMISADGEAQSAYSMAREQLDRDLEAKKGEAQRAFNEGVKLTDSLVSGVYALTILEKLDKDGGALAFRSSLDGTNLEMAKNFIQGYRDKKTRGRAKFEADARSIFGDNAVVDRLIVLAEQPGGLEQRELNAFYAKTIYRGSNAVRLVLPVREDPEGLAKIILDAIKTPLEEKELHYHGHISGPISEVLHVKSQIGSTPTGFVYWDIVPDFKPTEFDHKIESRLLPSLSKLIIDGPLPKLIGAGLSYVSLAVPASALEFLATRTRNEINIPANRVHGFEVIEQAVQQVPRETIEVATPPGTTRVYKKKEYGYKSDPTDADAVKKEATAILEAVSGDRVTTGDFMRVFSLTRGTAIYNQARYGPLRDSKMPGVQSYLPKSTVQAVLNAATWNGKKWKLPKEAPTKAG